MIKSDNTLFSCYKIIYVVGYSDKRRWEKALGGQLGCLYIDEINIGDIMGGIFPSRKKKRKLTIREAREILNQEECDKVIDIDATKAEAVRRAEQEKTKKG